ncbi:MAG: hypothetical protein KY476_03830 [Planctomycetes bacterium]|nr:hypothetical protein [Planctomycetota bacterium]
MPVLDREEYIEQAYFFRTYRERLEEGLPSQDVLGTIQEEVLATTRLPMALDFLRGEILLTGRISDGMERLGHYFTPFQTFVMAQAEEERSRFDQRVGLIVLEREARYRAEGAEPAGLFIFQFECLARNRLGYDRGMQAMAADPLYDETWRDWILKTRLRLGTKDFADFIYYRSQHFVDERRRTSGRPEYQPSTPVLFGAQEGRIANANRGKDPLYMFAALQRQLGYPEVPRPAPKEEAPIIHPVLEERLKRLEKRLAILEQETSGQFDISQFYATPPKFADEPEPPQNS